MQDTPKGLRLHIGIYGRRNVGKSSLLNALTRQTVSIVSATPGTTTDPVEKTMEMAPIGPVVFIDTAGIDDTGDLGLMRSDRTRQMFDRTDLALVASEGDVWGDYERDLVAAFRERKIPVIAVLTKGDETPVAQTVRQSLLAEGIESAAVCSTDGRGIDALRALMARMAPEHAISQPALLADLVPAGGLVIFVVPIDLGAPKGRLILPQVQAIRDILDGDAMCMVVKERELRPALDRLTQPPDLVVCDSQVVLKAAADTPPGIPLTTFSILMARFKGELETLARGAAVIETLAPGDRVLVAEACTHHPLADDIGRVKIPRWLRQYAGGQHPHRHLRRQGHACRPFRLPPHHPLRWLRHHTRAHAGANARRGCGGSTHDQLRTRHITHARGAAPRPWPLPCGTGGIRLHTAGLTGCCNT